MNNVVDQLFTQIVLTKQQHILCELIKMTEQYFANNFVDFEEFLVSSIFGSTHFESLILQLAIDFMIFIDYNKLEIHQKLFRIGAMLNLLDESR